MINLWFILWSSKHKQDLIPFIFHVPFSPHVPLTHLQPLIFITKKQLNIDYINWKKKRTELYKTEEIGHIALVAAMASHAALASSRIPTNTRLPSKNFHSFPTQCSSKVVSLCISSSVHVRRCFSGFLVYWDC